ncbi:hypothetical protein ASZ90_015424 [hydrocarbon metagenome]|uniref:Uncharacterized protein n=1 Tax=hydrocarbon metagenome TaxID=938273 RepID=A0A0W8F2E7_9ZZZZ
METKDRGAKLSHPWPLIITASGFPVLSRRDSWKPGSPQR